MTSRPSRFTAPLLHFWAAPGWAADPTAPPAPMNRRQALLAGLGLLLTGCGSSKLHSPVSGRPGAAWPDRPPAGGAGGSPAARTGPYGTTAYGSPQPVVQTPYRAPAAPTYARAEQPDVARSGASPTLTVLRRERWATRGPSTANINLMNGVGRITVHHEGYTPVTFTDAASTARRLEAIRSTHTNDRGWSDIGYHFIVDRAGRIWEGRDLRYQGAHVKDHNEHNLGILVLGNFDRQSPTDPQVAGLVRVLRTYMGHYRVPPGRVYTHQEIMPTSCPGRSLQSRMVTLRRGRYLG